MSAGWSGLNLSVGTVCKRSKWQLNQALKNLLVQWRLWCAWLLVHMLCRWCFFLTFRCSFWQSNGIRTGGPRGFTRGRRPNAASSKDTLGPLVDEFDSRRALLQSTNSMCWKELVTHVKHVGAHSTDWVRMDFSKSSLKSNGGPLIMQRLLGYLPVCFVFCCLETDLSGFAFHS